MGSSVTEQSVMGVIRAARPSFRNAQDKVVFAVHASFLASGFLLHATGPPCFSDDALPSTSTDEEVGIEHWNEFDDCYGFVYSNPDNGSKKVLVKFLAMNDKLLLDALREGDAEPVNLEINVRDYVAEDGGNNYSSMFKNIGKLVKDVDKDILGKLGGSSTSSSSDKKPSSESRVAEGDDSKSNQKPSSRLSEPDEPSSFNPPNQGFIVPPVPGSGVDDLIPGPGAGVYPRGNFGGPGSMLIGPNDPRWFGGSGHEPRLPGGLQPGIPPGARFDPYGPPGVPGFEPNRFIGQPRRPGGGTHPDLEHFGDGSDFI
ncbi:hypothetical protein ACH5RR_004911 [Cinchona calisaya]|uniref:PI31 proteasome regulator N-terminal domain-containing protein n=1 Tax=Cinchona calisaya TaxID=153742 RepID=A0ABD3AZD0_9GENT